jgi:hypothetical protein
VYLCLATGWKLPPAPSYFFTKLPSMTFVSRTLFLLAIYLTLWGINNLIYWQRPAYQQHPTHITRLLAPALAPRVVPVKKTLAYLHPAVHQAGGRRDELQLGELRATVYHATKRECDGNPSITADGSRIRSHQVSQLRWCAVSQDLLRQRGGPLRYGDTLQVTIKQAGAHPSLGGRWVVRDAMNARHRRRIDFLVAVHSSLDADQRTVLVRRVWKRIPPKTSHS